LGDPSNKTGLCIVTKRLDTGSVWAVTNNPESKYFSRNRFFLRDIIRASNAAPSYFDPEIIDVSNNQLGIFVDGGFSMMNNPSLQLFLTATLSGYKLEWKTGVNDMFLLSVGTGKQTRQLKEKKWENPNLVDLATLAPEVFMSDAADTIELLCQYLGKGIGNLRTIDSEIGDLRHDTLNGTKAFSYLRYNVEIGDNELNLFGITQFKRFELARLMEMDNPRNIESLLSIGEAAARSQVYARHFPECFDTINH
jgi:hypothetical protein